MANTLNLGNGQWATKEGSLLGYNSENNNYKPLPFNVERDSIATRVNKEGLIEVVGKDKLRIDYKDSAKGVALLEPSRTNLITYSEDFSNAWWLKINNVTVSAEKVISPDGTINASQLIFDGTSGGRIEKNITGLTQGADYSVSVYARVSSGTQVVNFGSVNDFEYTLTTEWQRLTSTEAENDTTGYPRLKCNDAATIEVWGFQLEQGSYATSYIKSNSGSAVTRLADSCNNGGNEQVINSTEGVFYLETSFLENSASATNQLSLSDGSGNNRIMIYPFSNTQLGIRFNANSSQLVSETITVSNLSFNSKIAVRWGNGNYSLYQNGSEVYTQAIASTPIGLFKLNFSSVTETAPFYGNVKDVRVYNTALTDQELQNLTS